MEAILVLPVLLLISSAIGQFAHIWYCRQILQYAAYSGARAALVAKSGDTGQARAREAAKRICALIALDDDRTGVQLPGIGKIEGSGAVDSQLSVNVSLVGNTAERRHIRCDVTMDVPLIFPFAGAVIGGAMNLYSSGGSGGPYFDPRELTAEEKNDRGVGDTFIHGTHLFPRIRLRERAYLFKPFKASWGQD